MVTNFIGALYRMYKKIRRIIFPYLLTCLNKVDTSVLLKVLKFQQVNKLKNKNNGLNSFENTMSLHTISLISFIKF